MAQAPLIEEINGINIGFLGFSQLLNYDLNVSDPAYPQINVLELNGVLAAITAIRLEVDFLVLNLHWGVEYSEDVRQAEIELAHAFMDAGADIIFGHHPHVIQPMELYESRDGRLCLVAYSLGNLISNQSRKYRHGITPPHVGATRDGVVLKVRIARIAYGEGIERVELRGVGYVPLFTENNYREQMQQPDLPTIIQTVPNDLRINELLRRIKGFELGGGSGNKPSPIRVNEFIALKKRLALYVDRKRAVMNTLGEDFCLPHR
jgi:poly-gamma-glutamate synthesis protein (capsule biosynthesis protein)